MLLAVPECAANTATSAAAKTTGTMSLAMVAVRVTSDLLGSGCWYPVLRIDSRRWFGGFVHFALGLKRHSRTLAHASEASLLWRGWARASAAARDKSEAPARKERALHFRRAIAQEWGLAGLGSPGRSASR